MPETPRSQVADRCVAVLCWSATLLIVAAFAWLVWDVLRLGVPRLNWEFLTTVPADAGRAGGISSILVSTLLVVGVCLICVLPLGMGTAAWLSEYTRLTSPAARFVQRSLDLLASIPSIVFGLFGMVFFGQVLHLGFSILSGGLTLACMVLPIVTRTVYDGLRSVPDELRLAAAAVGLRRVTTLTRLLLPAAWHGVLVGVILGLARALAETAALIFTSGYVTRMPESLLDSGRTLSVHIYDLAMNVPGGETPACATALVLLILLLVINFTASKLARIWLGQGRAA
jgi:phosphate transport system permease protein